MKREIRYQGAILRGTQVLLIKHLEHRGGRSYWLLPGGGREDGESERECVKREMLEETGLVVDVGRLIIDEGVRGDSPYRSKRTFLCGVDAGDPAPGREPEPETAAEYSIVAVRWFDLQDRRPWGPEIEGDPITLQELLLLQKVLFAGSTL